MKICTHCNQVYPTHKLSCKKTNPEYRLPTAEEFRTIKILDISHIWTDEELMIEFAKLHVEAALKKAHQQMQLPNEDLEFTLSAYPSENIK